MKKGILFLNGTPPRQNCIENIAARKRTEKFSVFCTDGAYTYITPFIRPDAVVGDFDSLDRQSVVGESEIIAFSADKDYTDGYLAVKIMIERGYEDIDIYGAYGGRPDMAESNYVLLALALKAGISARFCGEMNTYMINGSISFSAAKDAVVSLVPFTDSVHILYTKGLKYALSDYTMQKLEGIESVDYVMGVSNAGMGNQAEIALDAGVALVFVEEKSRR